MNVGHALPDFSLPDADGKQVTRADILGKWTVLYFYPADHTPGCTKQACGFRDAYQDFQDAGAEVIGVSMDGGDKHRSFIAKHDLPFPLLTDRGGRFAREVGVGKTLGIMMDRVTFVIDPEGIVRHRFKNQFQAVKHIPEALQAIGR